MFVPRSVCTGCRDAAVASRVDGSAHHVGGTGRLPIRPLSDTYPVPEAPQSRVALEYRPRPRGM
eukprot:4421656-Prymnesium_polylepis.1